MPPSFTGTGTFIASAPAFNAGMVNNAILKLNGGKVLVTGYTDATACHRPGAAAAAQHGALRQRQLELHQQGSPPSPAWIIWLEGENVVVVGDGAYQGEHRVAAAAWRLTPRRHSSPQGCLTRRC
jgi:hypothetical protein